MIFKSQLNDIFKDYKFENYADFKNASQLYFKGEIIDILSEKKIFRNLTKLKNELNEIDLEKSKKNIISNIEVIEPELDESLKQ